MLSARWKALQKRSARSPRGSVSRTAVVLQATRILELCVGFGLLGAVARTLNPAEFGRFILAQAIVTIAATLTSWGNDELIQREMARAQMGARGAYWVRSLRLRLGTSALGFLGAALTFYTAASGAPSLTLTIAVGIWAYFQSLYGAFYSVGVAQNAATVPALARLVPSLTALVGLVLFGGMSLTRVLGMICFAWAVICLSLLFWAIALAGNGAPGDGKTGSQHFSFSIMAAVLLGMVLGRQSDILVAGFLGQPQAEIGYYGAAFSIATMASTVFLLGIGSVGITSVAALVPAGREAVGERWRDLLELTSACSIPVLAVTAVLAPEVTRLVLGDSSEEASELLRWMSISFVAVRLAGGGTNVGVLIAMGRERNVLAWGAAFGVLNVALDLLLIPSLGMAGAIWATSVAAAGSGAVLTKVVSSETGISPPWGFYARLCVWVLLGVIVWSYLRSVAATPAAFDAIGAIVALVIGIIVLRPVPRITPVVYSRLRSRLIGSVSS